MCMRSKAKQKLFIMLSNLSCVYFISECRWLRDCLVKECVLFIIVLDIEYQRYSVRLTLQNRSYYYLIYSLICPEPKQVQVDCKWALINVLSQDTLLFPEERWGTSYRRVHRRVQFRVEFPLCHGHVWQKIGATKEDGYLPPELWWSGHKESGHTSPKHVYYLYLKFISPVENWKIAG